MADPRRQLAYRGLIATAAALIALAVLATVLTIIGLHDDATQDAERDAGNIATVLAEQTAHSVQAIDVALIELQGKVAASGTATAQEFRAVFGSQGTFHLLQELPGRLSERDVIPLIDADGRVVNNSRAFPTRNKIDLSDRDYFEHARRVFSTSMFVSEPLTNRYNGTRAIVFSRRL